MKLLRIFVLNLSLFALTATVQAQSDPVVMTVNGKDITLSEFEYSFNKNNSEGVIDRKSVEEYVPLFINFKLKVAAAEDARYDTLTSIVKDLNSYREQMLMPTLEDPDFIEYEARVAYDNAAARFAGQDLLTASHILVLMRQDATAAQQAAAKTRIDSIYQVLQQGADFATVAKECSDDKPSAVKGGSLGQFCKGMMIPDFEAAAYSLQPGQMSKPVKTTVGWHIIRLEDRHPFEPYEHYRERIIRDLEQRGIRVAAANHLVDSLSRKQGVSRDEMITRLFNKMIANDAEARFLAQEYYDGSLMFEISKNEIWDPAAADEAGQERYFEQHKKQYTWDSPRFKGAVIYAKDQATVDAATRLLKKQKDAAKWEQILTSTFNTDSAKNIRIEQGVYAKGDNANIDILVFGQQGDTKPLKGFEAVGVYGKQIKKPQTAADVKGQLANDYRLAKEQEWVDGLRKKYTFSVNEEVLKQVKTTGK